MGTDSSTCCGVLTSSPYPSSLAERTLRRQIPKVGARCVNHARRDLCGGCSAMGIPTAIGCSRILSGGDNASRRLCSTARSNRRGAQSEIPWRCDLSFGRVEQLLAFKRRGRPGPETIERELGLLTGFDIHKDVVVLLLGRLALPIEIRRIVCRYLDVCPAWESRVLFCAATAHQQIFHAIHLVELGRMHVPVEDDDVQVLRVRRNNLVGILRRRDGAQASAAEDRVWKVIKILWVPAALASSSHFFNS